MVTAIKASRNIMAAPTRADHGDEGHDRFDRIFGRLGCGRIMGIIHGRNLLTAKR